VSWPLHGHLSWTFVLLPCSLLVAVLSSSCRDLTIWLSSQLRRHYTETVTDTGPNCGCFEVGHFTLVPDASGQAQHNSSKVVDPSLAVHWAACHAYTAACITIERQTGFLWIMSCCQS
jgi:hypothetical protein